MDVNNGLMMKTQIGLGVLSIPAVFDVLASSLASSACLLSQASRLGPITSSVSSSFVIPRSMALTTSVQNSSGPSVKLFWGLPFVLCE